MHYDLEMTAEMKTIRSPLFLILFYIVKIFTQSWLHPYDAIKLQILTNGV